MLGNYFFAAGDEPLKKTKTAMGGEDVDVCEVGGSDVVGDEASEADLLEFRLSGGGVGGGGCAWG